MAQGVCSTFNLAEWAEATRESHDQAQRVFGEACQSTGVLEPFGSNGEHVRSHGRHATDDLGLSHVSRVRESPSPGRDSAMCHRSGKPDPAVTILPSAPTTVPPTIPHSSRSAWADSSSMKWWLTTSMPQFTTIVTSESKSSIVINAPRSVRPRSWTAVNTSSNHRTEHEARLRCSARR